MNLKGTYKVGVAGDRVARNDCCADAGEELLAGNNLLAHQVSATLRLNLVLDVARRETDAGVLGHRARDIGRAAESTSIGSGLGD